MSALLETLFGYQAWANAALFDTLERIDLERYGAERRAALRLISHVHVVCQIFAGHLQGVPHGFTSDSPDETPLLGTLKAGVLASDRWYLDYLRSASPAVLAESLAFTFTDGDKGFMTREEMLAHVALHGAYHRGEVGRILWQLSVTPPWDTLAVHLHQAEPMRRHQNESTVAAA